MKSYIVGVFFFVLTIPSYGQTIKDLEHELTVFRGSEKQRDKISQARLLHEIDPFNIIAIDFICRYYSEEKIDSVSTFFDSFINQFPNSPRPFLIRSELLYNELDYRDSLKYESRKIEYFHKALKIDRTNTDALFGMAEVYYKDYIFPFENNDRFNLMFFEDSTYKLSLKDRKPILKKSVFTYSADSALYYFKELWRCSQEDREIIYFPIKQLECFLNIQTDTLSDNSIFKANYCFFPPWYFADLSDNWECDSSRNYLFDVESSRHSSEWLQIQLLDLKEPCLYNALINEKMEIYRFTWLRSFHHPMAIRIVKNDNDIRLFWKAGKGAGGYTPEGIKGKGTVALSYSQWSKFKTLFDKTNFVSLPNDGYVPMTDGATWTLELKTSKLFKAHNTNFPDDNFKECCLYMLKLSGLFVKKEDIY